MKRAYVVAAVALVGILVGVGTTAAYFTSSDSASTGFVVGDVAAQVIEPAWVPTNDHVIAPGAAFDKDPQVQNTGANDAYARAHVSVP